MITCPSAHTDQLLGPQDLPFSPLSSQDPGIDLEIPWHNGLHDFSGYSDFSYDCMPHELYLILDSLSFYPIPPLPTLILKGNFKIITRHGRSDSPANP